MGPKASRPRVLIVDDDDGIRLSVARIVQLAGMSAQAVDSAAAALRAIELEPFDVVLADVGLPGVDGVDLLSRLRSLRDVQVVMMTGAADVDTAVRAFKAGAYGFLAKPLTRDAVVAEISNAFQYGRLQSANPQRPKSPRDIALLGTSPPIQEVKRQIALISQTDSTVLILGESGTGKELVAQSLHEASKRRARPFITVNCAAIAEELIDSELFGHVRGAFTGAAGARAGLFEAADGGTLFLDEVGELAPSAQAKLLRALQNSEIKPVGSDSSKVVDVRVLAATNVNLREAIAKGTFRQDLFYRLNVVTIQLPPLRERVSDILLLVRYFIERQARVLNRVPPSLEAEAARCLESYAWPGNVRELEHAIERAIVLSEGASISAAALPSEVRRSESRPEVTRERDVTPSPAEGGVTLVDAINALGLDLLHHSEAKRRVLDEFTNAYVLSLLKGADGNVSEAARRAGIDRSNFRRLLKAASKGSREEAKHPTPTDDDDE